ncbi:hypothetical protein G5C51_05055 [Streptomyces sp. A7024]|uniref:Uncharacterized protein n=1 Tax=Streptomyces coryli TaxID=1128680 RepID=A0A6G4TTS8_9ACTN|nr:hypothetical protein [Streptomyces coryli]NGN63274.1 hypothetical protein [Streptomyces coryli]
MPDLKYFDPELCCNCGEKLPDLGLRRIRIFCTEACEAVALYVRDERWNFHCETDDDRQRREERRVQLARFLGKDPEQISRDPADTRAVHRVARTKFMPLRSAYEWLQNTCLERIMSEQPLQKCDRPDWGDLKPELMEQRKSFLRSGLRPLDPDFTKEHCWASLSISRDEDGDELHEGCFTRLRDDGSCPNAEQHVEPDVNAAS